MTLGPILDTAIGLVFIYFLLSLIASGIQEVLAAIFAWRGTYLVRGLSVILDNNGSAKFMWGPIEFFLAHFTRVKLDTAADRQDRAVAAQGDQASDADKALQQVLAVQTHPLMQGTPTKTPSYIPAKNFSLALVETLRDGSKAPLFTQAERTIDALPDGDLKKTLSAFVETAGGDLDAFRTQLEQWFDDAMNRVSGVYTRLSQYVMIILGIALAIGLNVNSVNVTRTLWESPTIREALVQSATAAAQKQAPSASNQPANATPPTLAEAVKNVQDATAQFEATGIPFGWNGQVKFDSWTIGGWLITAAAIGLGAPFWFALLQQLVNIRNAGPKPASSSDRGNAT